MQFPQNNAWDALERQSLIPTMCQKRVWLTAMFDHLANNNTTARLITARQGNLTALAALEKQKLAGGITLPVAVTWDVGFMVSGTPLISTANPQTGFENLLRDARDKLDVKAVIFKKVQVSGQFTKILDDMSETAIAGYRVFNRHERAGLVTQGSYNDWFTGNFSRKRRKEYRRLRNRLADLGNVHECVWHDDEPVGPWIEEFLALEKAGWKGRSGTAIACDTNKVAHIRQSLSDMAQSGSLLFWKITLEEKVIASMFGFKHQQQVWLGKMAYDENLSAYSPGVLVILEATRDLLDNRSVKLADSSAEPGHPMIDNIWRDRIDTADYMVACPGTSKTMFGFLAGAENSRLAVRKQAKSVYHLLKKAKSQ